jgi:hypothetical protein
MAKYSVVDAKRICLVRVCNWTQMRRCLLPSSVCTATRPLIVIARHRSSCGWSLRTELYSQTNGAWLVLQPIAQFDVWPAAWNKQLDSGRLLVVHHPLGH